MQERRQKTAHISLLCLNLDKVKIIVYFYTVQYKRCYFNAIILPKGAKKMKVKNLNASSRKTKKAIKEAFAVLMYEKKTLSNITVKELVSIAGITRSSFYTHYDNIYEVAGDIQTETMEILQKNIEDLKSTKDFDHALDAITDYLKENEYIYSMILSSPEAIMYADHIVKLLRKKLDISFGKTRHELDLILYTHGCANLYIKHFRGETNYSLDEINAYLKNLAKKLFS